MYKAHIKRRNIPLLLIFDKPVTITIEITVLFSSSGNLFIYILYIYYRIDS